MTLRNVFLALTVLFWLAIAYYAAGGKPVRWGTTAGTARVSPQSTPLAMPGAAPQVARKPGLTPVTLAELARHATPDDCWIAINDIVYDLTGYIDLHPSKHQEMDGYCGKDGTRPWNVKDTGKDRGKPHSARSVEFLAEYPQMGVLKRE
jgi:cytochrome b involved in lipid metabolism